MKYELKEFQEEATKQLLDRMIKACDVYYRDGDPASCCLSAPTGAGKTIMVASAVEAIFNGNPEWGIERDASATVLWVSDSPTLNEQTIYKFKDATDLDHSLIETVENTFASDHRTLEPGHIYFLNRQKLSSTGLLTKGGEDSTFWDLLRRTENDPTIHLYMLYDEAHKGLGSDDTSDSASETITTKIIDGEDGKSPMPVVVGISATPKRFTDAMESRHERVPYPTVKVSPADVQASGLLKDKIILQAPTEGAAVYNIYLTEACKNLVQSTKLWELYCNQNDIPVVKPLMVVQVTNNITKEKIKQICSEIYEKIPALDRTQAFAHVMSGMGDLQIDPYNVPYVLPQDVQRKTDIRILFAKEAISTGWDCPRAEVIFSMRAHSDDTYIAQLIGRMVRTPLAESVSLDILNSVSCYLPYFEPKTLDKVVKYLTEEGNDDYSGVSRASGREVVTKPVDVEWDNSFGIDDIFTSIASRERAHSTSNYIDGVISYSGMLEANNIHSKNTDDDKEESQKHGEPVDDINNGKDEGNKGSKSDKKDIKNKRNEEPASTNTDDSGELEKTIESMLRALNESILTYADKFEQAKGTVLHAKSTKIEFQYLEEKSVEKRVFEDEADAYAIANAKRRAEVTLSPSVTNAYFRQELLNGKDPIDINVEIAAASAVKEIVDAVKNGAKQRLDKLTETYDPVIANCSENVRNQFASGLSRHGIPHTVFLDKPTFDKQDACGKKYPKHVVNDPVTHMAWFNLYESEDSVVMHELKNPNLICWYRNPVGKSTGHSLRIAYRRGDDRKTLHPDFIFFESVNGVEMPSIVDPHGIHLSDYLPKLKGISKYVEDFGDMFNRYWIVSDYKNQAVYLDLKDSEVRSSIAIATDIYDCFDKHGKKYMEGTLSKSNDGYREK